MIACGPSPRSREVAALYRAGMECTEIARKVGLSKSAVTNIVDRWVHNGPFRAKGRRWASVELALAMGILSLGQCPERCWMPRVLTPLAFGWRDTSPASEHQCPHCGRQLRRLSRWNFDGQIEEVA